ncbi:MAG: glycosyltransferase family 2 protein [Candidatus Omnitrophica bacterium]|nr:glycosyltransferase family 2 protein [Candidatus Omnitrophota bacterium]
MAQYKGSIVIKPQVSIIIPVYNEEQNLPLLLSGITSAINSLGRPFEIIAVDDASRDNSLAVLKELSAQYPQLRIVRFIKNSGQSAAFAAGFKLAQGEFVVTLDADLQYDPRDIARLLEKLTKYDVVCGWRKNRSDPWLKLISTKIANGVRNKISGENIKDTGCSLKAFKKSFLAELKMYKGMHRFLPTLLKMQGASVTEIEVKHFPRRFGRSKYNIRNRLGHSFLDLLFVSWMKKRNLDYQMEVIK